MEDKFCFETTKWVIIGFVCIVLTVFCYNAYITKKFVEGNYCMSSIPGMSNAQWVKCPEK